jgi:phage terminase large subunit
VSAAETARIAAPFVANAKQNALHEAWHDPGCHVVVASGAIRSSKSQGGGRAFIETALDMPSTYIVCRLSYRELEDSTKRMMLHGDGALPPLIPREAIDEYRATDNLVRLKTGSTILFRSLDEPAKLLNLTLGGAFIDQAEELDGGADGERVWDTILGRLSDPTGPRKALVVLNPGPLTHFAFRRFINTRTRDEGVRVVHFSLYDNVDNLPPDYVARLLATEKTRPHWFRSFVLGEWGAFEGAAYEEFRDEVHVVDPFRVPDHWLRFESMDHGAASPTAWLAWATDEDGNCVVFDEHYEAGRLVSEHAAEVKRRRGSGWQRREGGRLESHYCYADPSITASHGLRTRWGQPASVLTEYREHGVDWLRFANNDRVAGYSRLLELLHVEPGRLAPPWAHVPERAGGAPRLYVFRTCANTIEQLKSAPVASEGPDAGKAVEAKWEHEYGHAHAALRYGAMSRPAPSVPPQEPDDWVSFEQQRLLRRYAEEQEDQSRRWARRYVEV